MPLLSALGSPIKYAFGLRQASVEVEEVCLVQEMTGICPVPGQTSPAAGLCRGREVCLVQQMTGICPVPGQTSPAAAAAPKQAPVYRRADCVTPNRHLFTIAQVAWTQTGTCLPSRRLHSLKQAPVYRCAGLCRGREVCLIQEMTGICPVPGQTSPAAAAAPAGTLSLHPRSA